MFSVNSSAGTVTELPGSPFPVGPVSALSLAFSPSGNLLAVGSYGVPTPGAAQQGAVSVFSVDSSSGQLTQVPGSPFAAGGDPQSLAFSPSGNLLATANRRQGSVSVLAINPSTGALTPVAGSPWAVGGQPNAVAFSPSGSLLASASVFSFKISMFSVDSSTGALTQVPGSPFAGPTGAASVAFSPSGHELVSNASVYSVDPSTGNLTELPGSPFSSHGPTWGAFSPLGELLATANVFPHPGSVSIFKYQTTGGTATPTTVSKSLAVTGRAASIRNLLHAKRLTLSVSVPVPGREQIVWQYKHHRHPLTVASGTQTFKTSGHAKIVIHLTAAGRALLEHSRRIALTAVGTFKPEHGRTVTARRKIRLHK